MQCPRCGLQNAPDVSACARCGLPVPQAPGQPSPYQQQPQQDERASDDQASGDDQTTVIRRGGEPTAGAPGGQHRPPGGGQQHGGQEYGGPPQYGGQQQGPPQYGGQEYGPQQHAPPPYSGQQQGPPPHGGQQYGGQQYDEQRTYSGGATPSAAWPVTTAPETSGRGATGVAAMVMLTLGALLSLGYAGWAFTARRGIFADFADGNAVSVDDAESSDTIDTFFLIAAGVVALLALVLWIVRKAGKQTSGGALDLTGLALAAVGVVTVAVGLFLASGVPDADGQAAQGDKGVLAALVTGAGFAVLAIGLLVGIFAVRGSKQAGSNGYAPGPTPGYQNW